MFGVGLRRCRKAQRHLLCQLCSDAAYNNSETERDSCTLTRQAYCADDLLSPITPFFPC
jgi:hypothetical protein